MGKTQIDVHLAALCFHFANAKQDVPGHALRLRQPIDLWPRN